MLVYVYAPSLQSTRFGLTSRNLYQVVHIWISRNIFVCLCVILCVFFLNFHFFLRFYPLSIFHDFFYISPMILPINKIKISIESYVWLYWPNCDVIKSRHTFQNLDRLVISYINRTGRKKRLRFWKQPHNHVFNGRLFKCAGVVPDITRFCYMSLFWCPMAGLYLTYSRTKMP